MQKFTLSNGMKVIYKHKPGNAVVVEAMINVGSNDENPQELGISHFLEHILFEGTTKRPTNRAISNEIEKIGGDFNAYTTNERTCFYVKVLKKHAKTAVDVLADIFQDSLFKKEHIDREINVVLKEIDMINDEPRFYQWLLLQKNLFKIHPCGRPTYGDKKIIKNLTREKIITYFEKYYVPNNMTLCIVGDVKNWKKLVQDAFNMKRKKVQKRSLPIEPVKTRVLTKKEKRKIANSYLVVGYQTVPRSHKDAYVFEVINGILGRGQSGQMFTEIRSKRGLAYDVGTQHIAEVTFGYFAVYASVDKKNISVATKVILEELQKLKHTTKQELIEAKDFVEGDYLLDLEDTQKIADQVLFWEQVKSAKLMDTYIKEIRKVTLADIKRVVNKYFKNQTIVVLEGK